MKIKRNPAPNWYVVAFDETKYCSIAHEDEKYIEKILGVYFFNKSSHTYMAELTPSYHMVHGYNTIWFTDDVSDEKREELDSKYVYGVYDDESTYMHVSIVDAYMKKHKKFVYHYGKSDKDNNAEDRANGDSLKAEEEVREYISGNPPF